ncbi:hypothetical protein A3I53_02365 [Candidatus Curtissbacteria bacterium RIFCSPLOWO2_02_FULL_40_13b]|nr:MAG: hypothetical protein A3I53_02365 [Candidatus Curtissbacteria bacterium RIFCSPLOWO2_02_FULL_40_13b]
MIKEYGYQTAAQTRTFDTYNDVDCFNYSDVHDYIKFLKLGYGKATDHAVREIRLKRLTREEGINQVKNYQNKKPQNLQLFLDWIGMTELGFYFLIDQFRNLKIWRKSSEHNWTLKDSVTGHIRDEGVGKVRLTKKDSCVFQVSASKEPRVNSYILFGKGMDN